jgi:hypothetical protein
MPFVRFSAGLVWDLGNISTHDGSTEINVEVLNSPEK